jgi:diguanylate cyclase (GGDEF)-like protein
LAGRSRPGSGRSADLFVAQPPLVSRIETKITGFSRLAAYSGPSGPERHNSVRSTEPAPLSRTIASTATIRLARIPESEFLYTPIEERFERITRLARRTLGVAVAAVTLLDSDKQWFKSVCGWTLTELARDQSLCTLTVLHDAMTVIEDTRVDQRTREHALVTAKPHFRFYAGHPLYDGEHAIIGTFCVFDVRAREFSAADRECLSDLAALAQRELVTDQLREARTALTSKLGAARREAMMDPLTRLWNRRGASVLAKAAFTDADREGTQIAIALLDLDNFKRINDSYGHQIGDDVLRRVAGRLVGATRAADVICRLGGDEFLVLMRDTSSAVAAAVAERVRRSVNNMALPTRQGSVPTSVSAGLATRGVGDSATLEQLLERADQALIRAKAAGRNCVQQAG